MLARAGHSVVLVERGPFPGSKNMYGGVVYPRILDQLHPEWWEEAPMQRWVTRRSTMILTDDQALTVDFRTARGAAPPYNGATAYRPDFDHWLAGKAEAAGAQLVCSTTVTGLLRDARGIVVGVRTDRPDGDITARVVIACDGVNSFLAKEAGLYGPVDAAQLHARREGDARPAEGGDRRALRRARPRGRRHRDPRRHRRRQRRRVRLHQPRHACRSASCSSCPSWPRSSAGRRRSSPTSRHHPAIAPLVEGGEVKEYSAHLIPEAGLAMMPKMTGDGLLVAGDAAALCLAAGIWLEGVNFAMASGMYAGEAAAEALRADDTSAAGLAGYERRLERHVRAARPSQAAPGPVARAVRPGAAPVSGDDHATPSSACSASTTRCPSPACAASPTRNASAPA